MVAGRQRVGADHDAALHLGPEAGVACGLVHRADVGTVHAQAIADAVEAGQIGGGLGRRDHVVRSQAVAGIRQLDVDDLGAKVLGDRERLVEARPDAGLDTLLELGPRHAEAQAVEASGGGQLNRVARPGAGGVVGRVGGDHLVQERGIAHRQRHRPDLLE